MTTKNEILPLVALLVGVFTNISFAQTGKIAGQVTDAETGDPLPGVNIVVEGEQQGATTDTDGFYTILNVSPGTYTLRGSFVGYAEQVVEGVEVNIDLTTTVDFELQEEAVGLEEVVVQSQQPVVRPDISANVANIDSEDIENLPVTSVESVVGLQAGVSGLSVRGSSQEELRVTVDGLSMRDARTNEPFTGVSYTAVEEVQVQTGGFSAEYGNVRSGLVNVSLKDAPRDRYTADVLARYSPPSRKHFGRPPNAGINGEVEPEEMGYYIRPYMDPDVAFDGTQSGAWDRYTQRQYPSFEGWNSRSDQLIEDDNPRNDLTPEQTQEVWQYYHRKPFSIEKPDYVVDASVGGPIPVISEMLGNLRFFGSVRQNQEAYIIPKRREAYRDQMGQLRLTSDLAQGMKLTLHGLYAVQKGLNGGGTFGSIVRNGVSLAYNPGTVPQGIFHIDDMSLTDITRNMGAIDFTHTLGPRTFYEFRLQRMKVNYDTYSGPKRDQSVVRTIADWELTEAPYGAIIGDEFGPTGAGFWLGGDLGGDRDTSRASRWTGKLDVTSQVDQYNQVKAGAEFTYNDIHARHGHVGRFTSLAYPRYNWHRYPKQGAAYIQDKLEFQGMVANVGIRLDYFDPGGEWFVYDAYDRFLSSGDLNEPETERVERQLNLSPRVGVSFPISTQSKLFLNYGHFLQQLRPHELFSVNKNTQGFISSVGNPAHPMPRTIAYELGYEHSLFEEFLLRITGYYKALEDQPRSVHYTSIDGQVSYNLQQPYHYEDIRGFEISLERNVGRFIRGFANFTYMITKEGNFGYAQQFESRKEQRDYERETTDYYLRTSIPRPNVRMNVEFLTPAEWGPEIGGMNVLGDWRMSWLGSWRAGNVMTWPSTINIRGFENNVRWRGTYDIDLRLNKSFSTTVGEAQFFVDIDNVFNIRNLSRAGFAGEKRDFEHYMESLQLPESVFEDIGGEAPYGLVPGNDRPGDYREPGVEFVPIEVISTTDNVENPLTRPLYYEEESRQYMTYDGEQWNPAESDRVNQVLEDKAYIDMPNESYFTFLNPRNVQFGLRLSF